MRLLLLYEVTDISPVLCYHVVVVATKLRAENL